MGDIKQFTLAEVAQHTGRNGSSLWVVYKDDILDLTDFQYEHPGGNDMIQDEAGKDCTKAFDEVGHSGDAKKMIQKYKIGEIVQEERKYINGKRIVKAHSGEEEGRSCMSIVTCGLLGG